jgi:hypothetical protein
MAQVKQTPSAKPTTPVSKKFSAVYGLIIHPFTQARFDIGSNTLAEVDSWVQCQLDAGKLTDGTD